MRACPLVTSSAARGGRAADDTGGMCRLNHYRRAAGTPRRDENCHHKGCHGHPELPPIRGAAWRLRRAAPRKRVRGRGDLSRVAERAVPFRADARRRCSRENLLICRELLVGRRMILLADRRQRYPPDRSCLVADVIAALRAPDCDYAARPGDALRAAAVLGRPALQPAVSTPPALPYPRCRGPAPMSGLSSWHCQPIPWERAGSRLCIADHRCWRRPVKVAAILALMADSVSISH